MVVKYPSYKISTSQDYHIMDELEFIFTINNYITTFPLCLNPAKFTFIIRLYPFI